MNGVMERIAETKTEDPALLQRRALQKVFQMLKPGGCIYLGVANRFSAAHLLGQPDIYSGLPFVAVLPRRLADWLATRKGLSGYRTYLYSIRGYCRLLREAGFSKLQVFSAEPCTHWPKILVPLEEHAYGYYSRSLESYASPSGIKRITQDILTYAGLHKYLLPRYVIIAAKD